MMIQETPQQTPEGALLEQALKRDKRSARAVAPLAGITDTRWRQIVKGYQSVGGQTVPVIAPAATLARMAEVAGITPDQLREAGRDDAALVLEAMGATKRSGVALEVTATLTAGGRASRAIDEIDMIYASKSMTAEEKLLAIRTVLRLRAEVEGKSS